MDIKVKGTILTDTEANRLMDSYIQDLMKHINMVVLRPTSLDLSAFTFKEEGNVVNFSDSNGMLVPLSNVYIETDTKTYYIKQVPKNKLSDMMCTPLAETENYYVVKK